MVLANGATTVSGYGWYLPIFLRILVIPWVTGYGILEKNIKNQIKKTL